MTKKVSSELSKFSGKNNIFDSCYILLMTKLGSASRPLNFVHKFALFVVFLNILIQIFMPDFFG